MDTEALQDFMMESEELLKRAQDEVLRLESEPQNGDLLNSIFRAFHTMKGTAQYIGAAGLRDWTHDLETLLETLRTGAATVTSEHIAVMLQGLDVADQMIRRVATQEGPLAGPPELSARIRDLMISSPASAHSAGMRMSDANEDELPAAVNLPAFRTQSNSVSTESQPEKSTANVKNNPVADRAASKPAAAVKSIRIDAPRLDAVVNQVGELVLLRNRLASAVIALREDNEQMVRLAREMDLSVNDLQTTVMRLRMQPCRRLFQQLPRVVHDLSRQLAKEVSLEIEGEDVEIDKSIIDELSGPMTHLVRNSLDHGIELPDVREAAGKPRQATLRVAAVHLGDKIRLEVCDDGKGIDFRFIVQKAVVKGVVTVEQASRLSEQEALELIFRPGFSTKDQASSLSGRGVGMDVVKETAARLRGLLTIDASPSRGTTIAMTFPLTLAVLPVLYVRLRENVYALPVSSIESLAEIEPARIHTVAGNSAYRVDGNQTVPVIDLGMILEGKPLRPQKESLEGVLTERGLFVVSEVLGNEDSVVKPIDFISGANWYQGATISGGGNVVLILDAGALSAAAAARQQDPSAECETPQCTAAMQGIA